MGHWAAWSRLVPPPLTGRGGWGGGLCFPHQGKKSPGSGGRGSRLALAGEGRRSLFFPFCRKICCLKEEFEAWGLHPCSRAWAWADAGGRVQLCTGLGEPVCRVGGGLPGTHGCCTAAQASPAEESDPSPWCASASLVPADEESPEEDRAPGLLFKMTLHGFSLARSGLPVVAAHSIQTFPSCPRAASSMLLAAPGSWEVHVGCMYRGSILLTACAAESVGTRAVSPVGGGSQRHHGPPHLPSPCREGSLEGYEPPPAPEPGLPTTG